MKKYLLIAITVLSCGSLFSQEFGQSIASARSSYGSGDLEDTRFNLENALKGIDIVIGKEILKLLPTSLNDQQYVSTEDNVAGMSSSIVGLSVHREYGQGGEAGYVDILSDSPMLAGVNAILSMPMMMNSDPNQKVIKVQGYKSLMRTNKDETTNTITSYEVQVPFGKSMLTFTWNGDPGEAMVTEMMNQIPLPEIIKLAQ